MNYSFDRLTGPRQSRRENFEELISQLLAVELNARPVDGSGGDHGIDCFVKNDDNSLTVFQAKYFLGRLTKSQRRQIQLSLITACENHKVSHWILCIPINPSPSEMTWFDSLIQEGPVLEWWGETKIRTLLAKHPEISKSFFLDESIAAEFNAFRQEISGTIAALSASRWSYGYKHSESTIREYLHRASTLGSLLIQDAALPQIAEQVYVGLDFSELHAYMSSDHRFALSVPVVDFCIQQSPYPLYLLPGAAFELVKFMGFISKNIDRHIDNLKGDRNPLRTFLNKFEENPSNKATFIAYEHAIELIRSLQGPPSFNVKKLKSAVDSGRLRPSSSEAPFTSDDPHFEELLRLLLRDRDVEPFHARKTKIIDARNVTFLKCYAEKTGYPVRMISSDKRLAMASREYFGNASFIRNSAEFAYLIHSAKCQTESPDSLKSAAAKLASASKKLNAQLSVTNFIEDLWTMDAGQLRSVIDCFQEFAPFYRNLLRPVDEMIEAGFLTLPAINFSNMTELYMMLKRESDLVASFKSWWDDMSKELITIEGILKERYFTDELEL